MRIQCFVVSIFENKKIYFGNSKDSKSGNILLAHPVYAGVAGRAAMNNVGIERDGLATKPALPIGHLCKQ